MQKELNVLIVAGSLRFEGQGRANQDLIRSLHAHPEVRVSVVVSEADSELPLPSDITIFRVPDMYTICSLMDIVRYVRRLKKATQGVDVVHFATDFANFLLGALFIRKPYVITAHGTYAMLGLTQGIKKRYLPSWLRILKSNLIKRVFIRAAYIHAVSKYTAERIMGVLPQARPLVIPNAVNIQDFSTPQNPSQDIPKKFILSVGQVKPRKGIHVAVEAFAQIAEEFQDVEYVIVGDVSLKTYTDDIRASIQKHGLQDRVHILGRVSDNKLKNLFSSCQLYIQPSITVGNVFEGYGIVFLEAGVYHKAVIGTKNSGIEDAIEHGKTGFIVPQDDVPSTADVLRILLQDNTLRAAMGEANYKKTQSQDWSIIVNRFVKLYKNIIT